MAAGPRSRLLLAAALAPATGASVSSHHRSVYAVREINTALGETRPSLSRNGQRLYFGRAPDPEGMTDIYLSTRQKLED